MRALWIYAVIAILLINETAGGLLFKNKKKTETKDTSKKEKKKPKAELTPELLAFARHDYKPFEDPTKPKKKKPKSELTPELLAFARHDYKPFEDPTKPKKKKPKSELTPELLAFARHDYKPFEDPTKPKKKKPKADFDPALFNYGRHDYKPFEQKKKKPKTDIDPKALHEALLALRGAHRGYTQDNDMDEYYEDVSHTNASQLNPVYLVSVSLIVFVLLLCIGLCTCVVGTAVGYTFTRRTMKTNE
eukprot:535472_1